MPIAVQGRILHADGSPAAGLAFVLEGGGERLAGTTDARGSFDAAALSPPVTVCLLDGHWLAGAPGAAQGATQGATHQAYDPAAPELHVWGPPRAVAIVGMPEPLPDAAARALSTVDVLGPWDEGLLLVTLAPREVAELRARGLEVLVVDPDANQHAARVDASTPDELAAYVDARIAAARAWQARVPAGATAQAVDPPLECPFAGPV